MNILKNRVYVLEVNNQIVRASRSVAFAAIAYHSICNRVSAFFAHFRHTRPVKIHIRCIGSYVR